MNTLSRREEETLLKTAKARALRECDTIVKRASLQVFCVLVVMSHCLFSLVAFSKTFPVFSPWNAPASSIYWATQNSRNAPTVGRSLLRGHVKTSTRPCRTVCYRCEYSYVHPHHKQCAPSPRDEGSLMPPVVNPAQDRNRWPKCGRNTSDYGTNETLRMRRSYEHTFHARARPTRRLRGHGSYMV